MDREQINQGIKVENIDLTLERFEGNPILKPDTRHRGRQKPFLIRPPSMKAARCIFFIGRLGRPMSRHWDMPPV